MMTIRRYYGKQNSRALDRITELESQLSAACEELGKCRLAQEPRPMSKAPRDGTELYILMRSMYVRDMGWVVNRERDADGWLPLPDQPREARLEHIKKHMPIDPPGSKGYVKGRIEKVDGAEVISIDESHPYHVHITVSGGDDQEVANAIYESVPITIVTVGGITMRAGGSERAMAVSFSRPNDQPKESTIERIKKHMPVDPPGSKGAIKLWIERVNGAKVVSVKENDTSTPMDGQPPHSLHITVDGGDDLEVARAIYRSVSPGTMTFGAVAARVSEYGSMVYFSRPDDQLKNTP